MTRLEFFVACVPRKKNSLKAFRRGNHVRLHYDEATRAAQDTLAARVLEFRPTTPIAGPVRMSVTFVMPVTEGWPAWKKTAALEGRLHHVKAPDRGNLLKLFEDALTGPFFADDSQVCAGPVDKVYGAVPGYRVVLEELEQATAETEAARPEAFRSRVRDALARCGSSKKKAAKRLGISEAELDDMLIQWPIEWLGRCPSVHEGNQCGLPLGHDENHTALTPTNMPWFGGTRTP